MRVSPSTAVAAASPPKRVRPGVDRCLEAEAWLPLGNPALLFRFLWYSWLTPLIWKGYTHPIEEADLNALPRRHRSAHLGANLAASWARELEKDAPSIWSAYRRSFGHRFAQLNLLVFLDGVAATAAPYFLGRLLRALAEEGGDAETIYLNAGALAISRFFYNAFLHTWSMESWRQGMDLRTATTNLIYNKTLQISKAALGSTTTGHVINMCSADCERLVEAPTFFPFLWIAPVQLLAVVILAWQEVGVAALGGAALMLLTIVIQFSASRYFQKIRARTALATDERVKTMNELIVGVRVVKMYAWEGPFGKLVARLRTLELNLVRVSSLIKALNLTLFNIVVPVSTFICLVVYDATGGSWTVAKAFTTMAYFASLQNFFGFHFPRAVLTAAETLVVMRRLKAYLLLAEKHNVGSFKSPKPPPASIAAPRESRMDDSRADESCAARAAAVAGAGDIGLQLSGVTAGWGRSTELKCVDFVAKRGELVTIMGPVGSGKTTLLMVIMEELQAREGKIVKAGNRVFYASQEAWITSVSVRENIVFGSRYDPALFAAVATACQIVTDLESFADGYDTLVGERGITLSGGQKARISLCRAVYATKMAEQNGESVVLLLDDPFAAIDARVGTALYTDCIMGLLGSTTRILCTHQSKFAVDSDHVVVLDRGGSSKLIAPEEKDQLPADDHELVLEEEPPIPTTMSPRLIEHVTNSTKDNVMGGAESRFYGALHGSVFSRYLRSSGSWLRVFLVASLFAGAQVLQVVAELSLGRYLPENENDATDRREFETYTLLLCVFIVVAIVRGVAFTTSVIRSAQHMHDAAFDGAVGTGLRFFDSQPVGRILNRFSKDLGFADEQLPECLLDMLQGFVAAGSTVVLIGIMNPYLFIAAVPLVLLFWCVRQFYIKSSREVKRIEALARSPVYAHLSSTLAGLTVIRSHAVELDWIRQFEASQDSHSRAVFVWVALGRWLAVRIDAIVYIFSACTIFGACAARDAMPSYAIGLSIVYVLQLTGHFQWCIRQSAEVENHLTSCERIFEYADLRPEIDYVSPRMTDRKDEAVGKLALAAAAAEVPADWPGTGPIVFDNVRLRYSAESHEVLKGISFEIRPREKIGIVGRTGSGKSSMLAALLRLAPTEGRITLAGVRTDTVSLAKLRDAAVSVIPQDPVLFSGTVRVNLDPFTETNDETIWEALRDVHLDKPVQELGNGLDSPVAEAGQNFSVGQRQLMCLARAILRKRRILFLDEATANVDESTDMLIQKTIRTRFADCTVITIAHRLQTIMDSDRIFLLDAGQLIESGRPADLVEAKGAFFSLQQNHTA